MDADERRLELNRITEVVIGCAYTVGNALGSGFLEKVYENALAHRLRKAGLEVKQQYPIPVFDEDGTMIGDYYANLLVDGCLVVELKTAKALADEHVAQVLGYLKSVRLDHGLLINFGSYKFEIRKFAWSQDDRLRKGKLGPLAPTLSAISAFFAV